jgi:hypothetical protein
MFEKLDPGNLAGSVFKIMNLTIVSVLDYLLPFSWRKLAQVVEDGTVPHRILDDLACKRPPVHWYRAGCINIGVQVERHCSMVACTICMGIRSD